jgi:hypothetical protein
VIARGRHGAVSDDRHRMKKRNDDRYQPTSAGRRILILMLAVATALVIAWALLTRPGHVAKPRPDAPPCARGQTQNCVGGQIDVVVVPGAEQAASGAGVAASAPASK